MYNLVPARGKAEMGLVNGRKGAGEKRGEGFRDVDVKREGVDGA